MVHLSKLAVGIRDPAHLSSVQAERLCQDGLIQHRTRLAPRRAPDVVNGGSIYWVIGGVMLARQRIVAIVPAQRQDGVACAALHLDSMLIPVEPQRVRAFQGWRYLEPQDAPADLRAFGQDAGAGALPDDLRQALRSLALL